ncbi:hypothetical protein GWN42_28555, partial [candidate division KSB1 bacterium]|nr:hypothetical protein [candidate division KSB1 bacterium]
MTNPTAGHSRLPDRSKVKEIYEWQLKTHKASLQKLAQSIRMILEQQGLSPAIKYRIKNFDAYYDKLRKLNSTNGKHRLNTINDFFGLRIVCPFLEDIETVSSLIATHFELLETERKANQHSFREFGYDSVHLAVRMETKNPG